MAAGFTSHTSLTVSLAVHVLLDLNLNLRTKLVRHLCLASFIIVEPPRNCYLAGTVLTLCINEIFRAEYAFNETCIRNAV